jgi:hypothetical protein
VADRSRGDMADRSHADAGQRGGDVEARQVRAASTQRCDGSEEVGIWR